MPAGKQDGTIQFKEISIIYTDPIFLGDVGWFLCALWASLGE